MFFSCMEYEYKCLGLIIVMRPSIYIRVSPRQVYTKDLNTILRHAGLITFGLRLYGIMLREPLTDGARAAIMRAAYVVMHMATPFVEVVEDAALRRHLRVWAYWYQRVRNRLASLPPCGGERPGEAHVQAICSIRSPAIVDARHGECGRETDWGAWLDPGFWPTTV